MAKNRLAKFYAPKMYQPPAKVERSTMGRSAALVYPSLSPLRPLRSAGDGGDGTLPVSAVLIWPFL